MPLQLGEIVPGAIAYFDAQALNADSRVSKSGDPITRPGTGNQFVCYNINGASSFWAPLTATARPERLRIEAASVTNGYGPLAAGNVYLQDSKNTYAGASRAFVDASVEESVFNGGRRIPSAAGVTAVVEVVVQRGGQS